MSGNHRLVVVGLIAGGVAAMVLLVAFASGACPAETVVQPCADAPRNRVVVVALAASGAALLVAPFAFLGEVIARRRIVYRGAWLRAARRGALVGLVIATLAGLRLGGALSVPIGIFVITLAAVVEWFFHRQER